MDDNKGLEVEVTRPYTPISTNDQIGCFDLLIKDYGKENGWLSRYMCEDLPVGGMVREREKLCVFLSRILDFCIVVHIWFNIIFISSFIISLYIRTGELQAYWFQCKFTKMCKHYLYLSPFLILILHFAGENSSTVYSEEDWHDCRRWVTIILCREVYLLIFCSMKKSHPFYLYWYKCKKVLALHQWSKHCMPF